MKRKVVVLDPPTCYGHTEEPWFDCSRCTWCFDCREKEEKNEKENLLRKTRKI